MSSQYTFKNIKNLEDQYRKTIQGLSMDPAIILRLLENLDSAFLKLTRYIGTLRRHNTYPILDHLLEAYREEIETIHSRNRAWITLYCDLRWPADTGRAKSKSLALRAHLHTEAQGIWKDLKIHIPLEESDRPRIEEILSIKDDWETLSINSAEWRVKFYELSGQVYNMMCASLVESKYAMKNRFQIILSSESLINSDFYGDREQSKRELRQKVSDWILGYTPWGSKGNQPFDDPISPRTSQGLTDQLGRCEIHGIIKKITKALAVIVSLVCLGLTLHFADWDDRFYRSMVFEMKNFFQRDYDSLVLKGKKDFFKRRILNVRKDYSIERIRQDIEFFTATGLYQKRGRYLYFAENILKGFLLLLSDWNLEEELKTEVLGASQLLNPDISKILEDIIQLYSQQTMREKELRNQLLDLRRIFVRHGVFPFMFIVLKDNTPYLFLFPEKILTTYRLSEEALQKIGMDKESYPKIYEEETSSSRVYLVEGKRYPFQDRSGYFEGEFAVVLKSLSSHPDWTVQHEFGHVIDYLRFKTKRLPIPQNVELNAMLLPVVWAEERKEYIRQYLVREALKGDPNDCYSQAAKGILNGFLVYLSEKDPSLKTELISNRFEPERIQRVPISLEPLSSEELKNIGYTLYNDPEKYLSTAEKGRYVTVVTNAKEVIYGFPHAVAQRGFILSQTTFGRGRHGPRFIKDNMEEGEWSDAPSDWTMFWWNVLGMIFSGQADLSQGTKAEAVVAAMVVFLVFNGMMFLLQILGKPIRKRMFYGRAMEEITDNIFNHNAWSRGLSFGAESNERRLLQRLLKSGGILEERLKEETATFKAVASDRQRLLFDMCLFLAPLNPQKSLITNKCHDLLFFLPFLGPYWGRCRWIWPVQTAFHQREAYNAKIERLACGITEATPLESLFDHFRKVVEEYEIPTPMTIEHEKQFEEDYSAIERLVFSHLTQGPKKHHLNINFVSDRLNQFQENSQEFDHLDEYFPGDDIRRIDWKATARSPRFGIGEAGWSTARPMVRKYSHPFGIKIGLWLDMRFIRDKKDQEKWAEDFVKAVNIFHTLGEDSVLEQLIFVMRNGMISEHVVNLKIYKNNFLTSQKILGKVKEKLKLKETTGTQRSFSIGGLKFYSPEENERFLQLTQIADFSEGIQNIQWKKLKTKRLNMFMIGARPGDAKDIEARIGQENRIFI